MQRERGELVSRTGAIVLILVILLAVPAQAQVIPGRWEKIDVLSFETPITVDLKNGDRIKGQFEGLSPSELSLRTHSAQAAIPRAEVGRIMMYENDSRVNGTLFGAGVGAGIGVAIVIIAGSGVQSEFGETASGFALLGAGIGALGGWGIDATSRKEIVLYQAP